MSTLFLIPARGGSRGVPGKNIRLLAGKPLIVYSIEHALKVAPDATDVIVSTDSEEIADIAKTAGASIPFLRPAHLATSTATTRDVILHAADVLKDKKDYDRVVLLQPTSPFRNIEDIYKAMDLFETKKPDMVVTVKPALTNPYLNAYERREDGSLFISKGDGTVSRRQDAPPVWEFDGSIYVIGLESLRNTEFISQMRIILPVINSAEHNIDIDSEPDFLLAEYYASKEDK